MFGPMWLYGRSRSAVLVKLAVAVVVAGALAAGVFLPWVAGAGMVARDLASPRGGLPVALTTELRNTRVLAADGSLITEFYTNYRAPVTGDQIAGVMKQAQVDIEDARFYEHNGVDVQGT